MIDNNNGQLDIWDFNYEYQIIYRIIIYIKKIYMITLSLRNNTIFIFI